MAGSIRRNDPCPCGSGLKFKKCCQDKQSAAEPADQPQWLPRSLPQSPARSGNLLKLATAHWSAGRLDQAIATFREAVRAEPDSADTNNNLGAILFATGRLAESVGSLRRATALRPNFEIALRNLAGALHHLGRESEAAATYRELAGATKDLVERRLVLATALSLEGAANEAEAELRQAIAAAPANARAHSQFGRMLLEKGEFADAEHHLLKAIEEFPDAFQQLVSLRRFTDADRPLIDRMILRLVRNDLSPLQRGAIHFGLGKVHDDLKDYAEAIRHYDLGNSLRDRAARLDRAGLARVYDRLISDYSKAVLTAATPGHVDAEDLEASLPVLIVGMPRSGTTLVEQIVSSHPDVAAGGELPFWTDRTKQWRAASATRAPEPATGTPMPAGIMKILAAGTGKSVAEANAFTAMANARATSNAPSPAMLSQAAEDYLRLLRGIGPDALRVTDKAPMNLERLGPIRIALPAARIVYCRRQPVDNCLSIFFTNYQGRQGWSRADVLFQYRQHQRLIAHWRSVLPPDRFIEVDYEDMVTDREGQTRRLIAFCGLEWNEACLAPQNNRRIVKTSSVWQARQPTYRGSLDRWRHYEPWLGEFRELLADSNSSDASRSLQAT